jgi:hypothetical protein
MGKKIDILVSKFELNKSIWLTHSCLKITNMNWVSTIYALDLLINNVVINIAHFNSKVNQLL